MSYSKIKVIAQTNQQKAKYRKEPIKTQVKTSLLLKAREKAGDRVTLLGVALLLIGRKSGLSFLDQSLSEEKKSNAIPDYFRHSIETIVCDPKNVVNWPLNPLNPKI